MAKKVNHNKCPVCRKKFTKHRHSILKSIPYRVSPIRYAWIDRNMWIKPAKPEVQKIVTICGHCKAKIKRGKLERYQRWCDTHNVIAKTPIFDTDILVKQITNPKKHPKKSVGRGNYWSRGRGTAKGIWADTHNQLVKQHQDPRWIAAKQKEWTDEELRQFNKMLGKETAERHAAYADLERQLAEEFSEPFRSWLEK